MRTLAVARKQLTKQQLHAFGNDLKKARRLLKHREEKMRELYRSMESHLEIVGATAVEDQLQQGVPETLQALSAAGIHVWMLTGDKLETAINVAISCGLLTSSTKQLLISNLTSKEDITRRFTEIRNEMIEGENATLVIDGESLAAAFSYCKDDLRFVALAVFRVVCCRMAPLQKAQVLYQNSIGLLIN
jgi:phospholipid-translocating ATPase